MLRETHPNASSSSGGVTPVDAKGKGKAIDELAELDDILADMHNETLEPSAKMSKMVDLLKQCKAICFLYLRKTLLTSDAQGKKKRLMIRLYVTLNVSFSSCVYPRVA